MVLVDWQIAESIKTGKIKIVPLMGNAIQPNSVDLRLGSTFATYSPSLEPIDPFDSKSIKEGLIDIHEYPVYLHKFGFLLGETLEYIELPDDVCATVEGKSSLARLGLTVHQTGGFIDCGFHGTITLEMTNENNRPIILRPGMPIAQLVFYETLPARVSYGSKTGAKYHKQRGVTGSKYYENPSEDL